MTSTLNPALKRKKIFICYDRNQISESEIEQLKSDFSDCTIVVFEMKLAKEKKEESAKEKVTEMQRNFAAARTASLFVAFISKSSIEAPLMLGVMIFSLGPVLALTSNEDVFHILEGCQNPDFWPRYSWKSYRHFSEVAQLIRDTLSRIDRIPRKPESSRTASNLPVVASEILPPAVAEKTR